MTLALCGVAPVADAMIEARGADVILNRLSPMR